MYILFGFYIFVSIFISAGSLSAPVHPINIPMGVIAFGFIIFGGIKMSEFFCDKKIIKVYVKGVKQ